MRLVLRISGGIALALTVLIGLPTKGEAQDRNGDALALVSAAMDAYSNLLMDKAKSLLDEALAMQDGLDGQTLAKVHIGFGVLWAGGYSNSAEAKNSFSTALCYDNEVMVDSLFSTPEIDLSFTEAKSELSSSVCRQLGIGSANLEPCGYHEPFVDQRKSYELPFYLEVNPAFSAELDRVAVKYAFDGKSQYRTLNLEAMGNGYGAMVECDSGEIRSVNPGSVQYYIEGYDASNNVICRQGAEDAPLEVLMSNDVPIVSRPGLDPLACSAAAKKAEGQPCSMTSECKDGLTCNTDTFLCEGAAKEKPRGDGRGPKKFYVNLTGGVGFGYFNKSLTVIGYKNDVNPAKGTSVETEELDVSAYTGRGGIEVSPQHPAGTGWSGVPIRLAVGYKLTPKLSLEVSGRVDGFVVSNSTPKNCWDYAKGNIDHVRGMGSGDCTTDFNSMASDVPPTYLTDYQVEEMARNSAALTPVEGGDGTLITDTQFQVAWLVNARVRYQFLTKNALQASVFGGIGYGHIQYRVEDSSDGKAFYPMPGMVDIELGVGLAYYFTDNVGLVFDLPIDFMVGDGFAANFDFNLGLGFGF